MSIAAVVIRRAPAIRDGFPADVVSRYRMADDTASRHSHDLWKNESFPVVISSVHTASDNWRRQMNVETADVNGFKGSRGFDREFFLVEPVVTYQA
jgi:hypothetical protein